MNYLTILTICLLPAFIAACGGSSDSESVPGSTASQTGDDVLSSLGSTSQTVIDQCMSDADKEMLARANAARSRARNCGSDNYPATAALSWHCTLESVAFGHSRDMGDNNFFNHTGSDGLNAGDRITNAGYDWFGWGENIAAERQTIEEVMTGWLNSPGHCANIMNSAYTEFGAAVYFVAGSDYSNYWTQVFARPRN